MKQSRPEITTATFANARCGEDGGRPIAIRHLSKVAHTGVSTELAFEVAVPEAVTLSVPVAVPASAGRFSSSGGASAPAVRAISFVLRAGELRPGGRISGSTSFQLEGFAPGMSVVQDFADVPVAPEDAPCGKR